MANKLKSFARSERKRAFDRPFSIVGNLIDLFAGTDEEEEPTPLKQFDPNKDYYGPTGHGPFSAGDTPWPRYDEDVVAPFEFPDEFKDVGAVHNPWNKRTTEVSVLDGKTLERGKIANVVDARGTDAIDTDTNLRHEFRHKTIRENPNRSKIFELRKQMGMSEEAFTQLLDYKYARTPQERSKARVWLMHPTGGGFPQEPTEVLNLFSGHIDKIEKLAIEGSKRRVTDPRFRGPIEDSYQYGQLLKRQQEDPDFLALPPQERRETLDMQISPYLDSLQGAFERGMPGAVVNAMPPEPVDRGKTFGQFIDMRNEQVSAPWKKAMEGDAEAAYELAEGFVGGGITKVVPFSPLRKSIQKSVDKFFEKNVGTPKAFQKYAAENATKLTDKESRRLLTKHKQFIEEASDKNYSVNAKGDILDANGRVVNDETTRQLASTLAFEGELTQRYSGKWSGDQLARAERLEAHRQRAGVRRMQDKEDALEVATTKMKGVLEDFDAYNLVQAGEKESTFLSKRAGQLHRQKLEAAYKEMQKADPDVYGKNTLDTFLKERKALAKKYTELGFDIRQTDLADEIIEMVDDNMAGLSDEAAGIADDVVSVVKDLDDVGAKGFSDKMPDNDTLGDLIDEMTWNKPRELIIDNKFSDMRKKGVKSARKALRELEDEWHSLFDKIDEGLKDGSIDAKKNSVGVEDHRVISYLSEAEKQALWKKLQQASSELRRVEAINAPNKGPRPVK